MSKSVEKPRTTVVVRVHKDYARLLKARAKKAGHKLPEYTRRLVPKKGAAPHA